MRELRISGTMPLPSDPFEEATVVAEVAPLVNDFIRAMSEKFPGFKLSRDIMTTKPRVKKATDAKPRVKAVA